MSRKNPNSFGVQGSGSPNVITLKRPPPRSFSRSQAMNFAVWLVTYAGDLDAFLATLLDVWGERYGEEEIPPWLLQLAGPFVPDVEVVAAPLTPMARPRADRATTAPRGTPNAPVGLRTPPRVKATPPSSVASTLDNEDNPGPLRGRPPGAAAPKPAARSRLTLNGKPLDRAGIAKVAAEAEAAITGAPVRRAAAAAASTEETPDNGVDSGEETPDDGVDNNEDAGEPDSRSAPR